MYNYREVVKEDVRTWMEENSEHDYDVVFDACWVADEVTGNGSGSYTFSRLEARNNFFEDDDADDYIYRICDEGLSTQEEIGKHMADGDWEWVDVLIRCYLLGDVLHEIIDEEDK